MPRKRRESSTIAHKNLLPIIDLSEDSNSTSSISNITIEETVKRNLLDNNDNTTLLNLEDNSPNDEHSDDEDDNSITYFNNNKRKNKEIEDAQKKIRKLSFIYIVHFSNYCNYIILIYNK